MFSLLGTKRRPFYVIYLATFLFAMHIALPLYVNSSFLLQFYAENTLGLVYVFASVFTIFALGYYPKVLGLIGNYRTTMALLLAEAGLLSVLAFSPSPVVVTAAFIAVQVLITLCLYNLDVFLEKFSDDRTTGAIRGTMLTVINIAILLGPLMGGIILSDGEFWKIYLLAAIFLFPIMILITRQFRNFKDSEYDHSPFFARIKEVLFAGHPNDGIRHVVISNILMRFFYSWMVLYLPIYLHKHIGFSWSEIGIILTVMLLPFVLLEVPVGRFVDRTAGERKVMAVGFLTTALFTASLFFAGAAPLVVWTALLFGSRIGLAFIEVTTESYFFKHIKSSDTNVLSIFRDTRPIAYITGPLAASLLLSFMPIQSLFLILAAIMAGGIWNSMRMR